MKKKISSLVYSGKAPVHLLSVKSAENVKLNYIVKLRKSKKYHTDHLQIGTLYKSSV